MNSNINDFNYFIESNQMLQEKCLDFIDKVIANSPDAQRLIKSYMDLGATETLAKIKFIELVIEGYE